ncbi:MAG: dipeptidase [Promethearchaeota archaeon]
MSPIFPVIDGHIDTISSLKWQKRKFSERNNARHNDDPQIRIGHCDKYRMRKGHVQAALFAIYPAKTKKNILDGLDNWFHIVNQPENNLMQIKSVEDFTRAQAAQKIGAVLHFEGAGGIETTHRLLRLSYQLGLRTMGLSWSNINKFVTGMSFEGPQPTTGMTKKGRALVHEAQALGITIDVSHLNDVSFWDVMEITEKPIFATHSNARAVSPHLRNLSDEMLKEVHEKHGTVGINFGMNFLAPDPSSATADLPLDIFRQHIDHIVETTDINTVAIGSDYDGTDIPTCMKDSTYFPKLWDYLLENGYSKHDLHKISHENLLRVFSATWK